MRDPGNMAELSRLSPVTWMGMIFHPGSRRAIPHSAEFIHRLRESADSLTRLERVGVFVNQPRDLVLRTAEHYALDRLQLHGEESPEYCARLSGTLPLIKAFRVGSDWDADVCRNYEGLCSHFLFDADGPLPGGNGRVFDWSVLKRYTGPTPFLLAGGLGPHSAAALKAWSHPAWAGIDLNSGFELSPGFKDIGLLENFLKEL